MLSLKVKFLEETFNDAKMRIHIQTSNIVQQTKEIKEVYTCILCPWDSEKQWAINVRSRSKEFLFKTHTLTWSWENKDGNKKKWYDLTI